MFCPKCGNEVAEGTAYCGNCGQKMDTPAPAAPAEVPAEQTPPTPSMFCPKCGSPIFGENAACTSCGWKSGPSAPTAKAVLVNTENRIASERISDSKIKKGFLVLAALIAVVIIAACIVTVSSGDSKIAGEWESDYGDTIEFNEDGTCDIDEYILSLVSGSLINDADDQMYDVKLGGKIEVSYTSGRSVRSVEIEYKLKGDTLTLGNMTFERES